MMMRETKAMDFFQEVMEAQQKYVETDIPCFVERCGIGMHQLTLLQALGKLSLCPKNFRGEIIKGQACSLSLSLSPSRPLALCLPSANTTDH